ncbi:MAG: hypothetical protein L7F78_11060 [Syntrophales bacterium LBB04]|nr:hypothetical protein [Syntrophales bacterium LBB04]
MKKNLLVIFALMMMAVTFMPQVASADFSQYWAEPSNVGSPLTRIELWIDGGTFSAPITINSVNNGGTWNSVLVNPSVAYLTGPPTAGGGINSIYFTANFSGGNKPFAVNVYDFNGTRSQANMVDYYQALYDGKGQGLSSWHWGAYGTAVSLNLDGTTYDVIKGGAPPLPSSVPIPGALLLFGPGLAGLVSLRKRFTA